MAEGRGQWAAGAPRSTGQSGRPGRWRAAGARRRCSRRGSSARTAVWCPRRLSRPPTGRSGSPPRLRPAPAPARTVGRPPPAPRRSATRSQPTGPQRHRGRHPPGPADYNEGQHHPARQPLACQHQVAQQPLRWAVARRLQLQQPARRRGHAEGEHGRVALAARRIGGRRAVGQQLPRLALPGWVHAKRPAAGLLLAPEQLPVRAAEREGNR